MSTTTQITRVAAYGLLLQDDAILLCRISPQLPAYAGQWTLPGGGLEFGEHPETAMVREVQEETGLTVRKGELATVDSIQVDVDEQAFHSIRVLYHADILGGELTNELDGTTDKAQWWPLVALPELVDLARLGVELVLRQRQMSQ